MLFLLISIYPAHAIRVYQVCANVGDSRRAYSLCIHIIYILVLHQMPSRLDLFGHCRVLSNHNEQKQTLSNVFIHIFHRKPHLFVCMNALNSESLLDKAIKFGMQVSVYSTHITHILLSCQVSLFSKISISKLIATHYFLLVYQIS